MWYTFKLNFDTYPTWNPHEGQFQKREKTFFATEGIGVAVYAITSTT